MCITSFFIKIFSDYVGHDKFGNRYYISNSKRRVIYKGLKEPSKIPPMWHAWLHYLTNDVPTHDDLEGYNWQKAHIPNLTGTKEAYHPERRTVSADYQPWKPS